MSMKEKRERARTIRAVTKQGFSRKMGATWYKRVRWDNKNYGELYSKSELRDIHNRGYLARSIDKYDLLYDEDCDAITDFQYLFLSPYNNSFSKWLDDIITTSRILSRYSQFSREIYFSIIERNRKQRIFKFNDENREYTIDDIMEVLEEKKILELRPAFWLSKKKRYKLEYKEENLVIDDYVRDIKDLEKIIRFLDANYIVSEYIELKYDMHSDIEYDGYIKMYVTNDIDNKATILDAYINLLWSQEEKSLARDRVVNNRRQETLPIDLDTGTFEFEGKHERVINWETIKNGIVDITEEMKQLSFFSVSLAVCGDGFKFLSFSAAPNLPTVGIGEKLNAYLKERYEDKRDDYENSFSKRINAIREHRFYKFVAKHCRPGIRPYMQRLWFDAVKDDFKHTHVSIFKKIWAWRRGFLSYRIEQYNLTNQNYKNFLSDYDYHWLNRINNSYQIWLNDKTTFRYILAPFKEYIPDYYYSIFNRSNRRIIKKMHDCPEGISEGYEGIFELLQKKGKLALKPSAGTHGDGFYCLSSENGSYAVNGEEKTKEEIIRMIEELQSFYLVTEFISMNASLKQIYDKSVNSVRMMVINQNGYEPQIMQAYMRIGSSSTGYTDNVGYGGICVMIDEETGEMYNPERIIDHKFEPCRTHPDTGTEITGKIPNWELVCSKILEICRFMPELEYLGFDIAITDDAFQIIEINIHQDLHKVATHSTEIKKYFNEKIRNKKRLYKIK